MHLGSRRRLLSVILSVIIAFACSAMVVSTVFSQTLASQDYLKENMITEELVNECSEQLDIKYAVLAAETGIPERVFETVKNDYGIENSLSQAVENIFGEEDPSLYNVNLVDYFNNLCAEYLDGNNIKYNTADVNRAAEKAAKIYSDTVGVHHTDTTAARIQRINEPVKIIVFISLVAAVVCIALFSFMYSNKRRMMVYPLGAIAAGMLGTAVGAALCALMNVGGKISVTPTVYQNAMEQLLTTCLLYVAGASFVIAVAAYVILLITVKQKDGNSPRGIAV